MIASRVHRASHSSILCVLVCVCMIDCTRKWIGNAVQNCSSSSVRSRNVVSLFSSPSTSSQKVRKCGGHSVASWSLGQILVNFYHCFSSLQRCCWKMMLLSLHPNIIVHVENVVSLFSSPSTSSQKVRKCGSHHFFLRPYRAKHTPMYAHCICL